MLTGEDKMIQKSAIFLAVLIMFSLLGCPEISNSQFSYDPDPVDPSVVLPDPAEDLYIVANIGGGIYGFYSSDPLNYTILVTDASIEEYFSEIRISPSKEYLLYTTIDRDLILLNILTFGATVISTNIESNESEFIDNTKIFYTFGGSIRIYEIGSNPEEDQYTLISNKENKCNHWAQLSPNVDRIAFKDQSVATGIGFHSWDPVEFGTQSDDWYDIFEYAPVGIYESFFYTWRDNNRVLFKNESGETNTIYEKNVEEGSSSTNAILRFNGINIPFEKLMIFPNPNDPDIKHLLIYGRNGLYILDIHTDMNITGIIEPNEIYVSSEITKYAAVGSLSKSFVVGTENWMGIYNTNGLQKTNASIENIFGDSGTLYGLHCR